MVKNNIILLCDAVQTGKTTALLELLKCNYSFAGFLTPDINTLRCFIDLEDKTTYPFQKPIATSSNDIAIGKYIFDAHTFDIGKKILNNLHLTKNEIIIIDEIGKLEMNQQGFEPELGNFISKIADHQNHKIIFVVRETLLVQCLEKYNLQQAIILNVNSFKAYFKL